MRGGKQRARFIVIEGLSGSGKSTVAPELASRIDGLIVPSIPEDFAKARRRVDRYDDVDTRYLCYLSAVLSAGEEIRGALARDQTVIAESYVYRTIAYHKGMGATTQVTLEELGIPPSVGFFLDAPFDILRERMSRRDRGMKSKWDIRADACLDAIRKEYLTFDLISVDAAGSVEDSVNQILAHLSTTDFAL